MNIGSTTLRPLWQENVVLRRKMYSSGLEYDPKAGFPKHENGTFINLLSG
jgi:hypothetical protein